MRGTCISPDTWILPCFAVKVEGDLRASETLILKLSNSEGIGKALMLWCQGIIVKIEIRPDWPQSRVRE